MDELTRARRRFEKIAKGEYVPREISPEEAKARLRAADPGIDLAEAIRALNEGDLKKAGLSLLYQSLAPETVAFFAPLLAQGLQAAFTALNAEEKPRD
ncbi:hypothetical protein [Hydrogenimonas sp. SS33]|uniref:hypothetical protein n=1 Tax=Hydrogenimonas leucolamina TaxID=2954236 RepID=UPI00336BB23A